MLRRYAVRGLGVLFVIFVLAMLLGQALGQPVLLSFVTTGSMSPTIEPNDGFFIVPSQFPGEIGEGDVIVFDAQELEGGGLTTHRVVGETDEGFITQGDANPFTDQDGDEPPVTEDRIVGTAFEINNNVVTIPGLGTAVFVFRDAALGLQQTVLSAVGVEESDGVQSSGIVLVLAGMALLLVTALDSLRGTKSKGRSRNRRETRLFDPRFVLLFLLIVVLLPANAAMLGTSGTHEVTLEGPPTATGEVSDEPAQSELTATNNGLVAMLVVLETPTEDAGITNTHLSVPGADSRTSMVTAPAPPPGEERTVTVTEQRYIIILPESVLTDLHAINPWLPIAAINAVLGFGILAFAGGLLGFRRRRIRDTDRDVPLQTRAKRLFRRTVLPQERGR